LFALFWCGTWYLRVQMFLFRFWRPTHEDTQPQSNRTFTSKSCQTICLDQPQKNETIDLRNKTQPSHNQTKSESSKSNTTIPESLVQEKSAIQTKLDAVQQQRKSSID
jgi:thiol:disulfide interchange protein